MKSVIEWLNTPVEVVRPGPLGTPMKQKTTVLKRISELIAVNGGSSNVTGFGNVLEHSGHPYKRLGLRIDEAMELINLTGILNGFLWCHDDVLMKSSVTQAIQGEIERVKADGFDEFENCERIEESGGNGTDITGRLVQLYGESELKKLKEDPNKGNKGNKGKPK